MIILGYNRHIPNFQRASLVAQLVKNTPAIWEIWVRFLGWGDPLEKGKATLSSILAWRIPWTVSSMDSQIDTTEWLSLSQLPETLPPQIPSPFFPVPVELLKRPVLRKPRKPSQIHPTLLDICKRPPTVQAHYYPVSGVASCWGGFSYLELWVMEFCLSSNEWLYVVSHHPRKL